MGRIVVTEFVSLDGVMEDPGGSEDFEYGGWSFEIDRGDEGNQFKLDEALSADALLFGHATYDGFAAAWPTRTGEFADKFNSMPKYVVSSTLKDPDWSNTTVIGGDLAGEISKLKQAHDGDIVVHGSAQLVQTLLEHDLVDELRLMVFPVVLGRGKRLFGETSDKKPLRQVDSKAVGDGVAILVYTPARVMSMEPVTELDPRFSDPGVAATPWDETRRSLEAAELFWISTVRSDGRPHVTPLVAVWLDEALYFCTGATEQKYLNLSGNPHVILMTGCNDWEHGLDVVVEGDAVRVTDEHLLERLAAAWAAKWDGQWNFEARDGALQHESGSALVFAVAPSKVLAFAKGNFSHTRHRFA